MKKQNQRERNPYPYTDSNKRYQTFDYYMKQRFGGKCAKISLDAGFTCPNIDGKCASGGCIYCYSGSSGAKEAPTLREQYDMGVNAISRKWGTCRYIPYLQAHTNTYAPVEDLKRIYDEVLSFPNAVTMAIATRADCLSQKVVDLLAETSQRIPLIVELGLQSIHDTTARLINRGHTYEQFLEGYNRLKNCGGDIMVGVHLINGLPGESIEMMIESARQVAALKPHMVKLHLLHILKNTPLEKLYLSGRYETMDRDTYIDTVVRQLEVFSPDCIIGRVTGDAPFDLLVEPQWCRMKTAVANDIDKKMYNEDTYQGKFFVN